MLACPFRSRPANIADRGYRLMTGVFGRLKPGTTLDRSVDDIAAVAGQMAHDHPKFYPEWLGFHTGVSALRSDLTRGARPMLILLLGASAIVLLIACANVANLILARMGRREMELVIRSAMGAGSGRLLRQLLTENLILALLAAAVGLVFAAGSLELLTRFAGQLTPRAREIAIDGRVLAFAILCASATTFAFGSASVLYSRREVASPVPRTPPERGRNYLRSVLIASQVAFSYVLLIGAGLMVRSFIQLNRVDPGYVPQRVYEVGFQLNWSKYPAEERRRWVTDRLLEKVQNQPGVMSAAIANGFPMDPDFAIFGTWQVGIRVEGDSRIEAELPPARSIRDVTPGYFQTLGIPLISGRAFLDSDTFDAVPVVLVNRTLASRVWGDGDPLGRRISFDGGRRWHTIVGVVGDTREFGLSQETPTQVYLPLAQNPDPGTILVRTGGEQSDVAGLLRRAVLELDPQTAITSEETLAQAREDSVSSPRDTTRLFALFAVLAFLIAVTGIGSMLALWVRQRTKEIGIRIALGARPMDILGSVIRQGMVLVAIGLALGLGGAIVLTRFLRAFLFQVDPTDAATYLLVSFLLLAAAVAACYVPARRAARIDPQAALRCD
jgi:predicted permease